MHSGRPEPSLVPETLAAIRPLVRAMRRSASGKALALCAGQRAGGGCVCANAGRQIGSVALLRPISIGLRAMKGGLGCNASHYLPAEMLGQIVPDRH